MSGMSQSDSYLSIEISYETIDNTRIQDCSDASNDDIDKACSHCVKYIKLIHKALGEVKTENFKTYVPYINRVTDHWFRNVYFTKNSIGADRIVQNDNEYEQKTGERWTLYETDEKGNYQLYVYLKENGEYKTEFKEEDDKWLVCRKVEAGNGNYKLADDGITYQKASGGEYKLQWKDSENNYSDYASIEDEFRVGKRAVENTDIGDDYLAYEIAQTDDIWQKVEVNDNSPESLQELEQLGQNIYYKTAFGTVKQVEDGVRGETNAKIKKLFLDDYYLYDGTKETAALIQKAKEMADVNIAAKQLEEVLSADDMVDTTFKSIAELILYDRDDPDNFPKDKKIEVDLVTDKDGNIVNGEMTLHYDKYKTEGDTIIFQLLNDKEEIVKDNISISKANPNNETVQKRAEQLAEELKKKIEEDYIIEEGAEQLSTEISRVLNAYTISSDITLKCKPKGNNSEIKTQHYTATIDQISGPISLSHSSLTAFSMLENMHTLDSEFIYRDFKELIVELNYFDKEDLVEAEDEVMMFPVSGISPAGWPVARYDKTEDYGTLIHSAEDLRALKKQTQAELAEILGNDIESETDTEETKFPTSSNSVSSNNSNITSSDASVTPSTDGTCDNYVTINGVTYKQFFQFNYQHIILPRTDRESGRVGDCGCGFCSATSIITGYGNDVNLSVMKDKLEALGMNWNNSGRETKIEQLLKEYNITGSWDTTNTSGENLKNAITKAFNEGKPVLVRIGPNSTGPWTSKGGHYFVIVGVDSAGTLYTVDSATANNTLRSVNSGGIQALVNSVSGSVKGIWIPDQAPDGTVTNAGTTEEQAEFAGFEGGETVVSPVTGEVVEYGTTKRKNIETSKIETDGENANNQYEEVGFIKIRLLGNKDWAQSKSKDGCQYFTGLSKSSIQGSITGNDVDEGNATSWLEGQYTEEQLQTLGYDYFWEEYNDAGIGDHYLYIEGFDVSDINVSGGGKNVLQNKENIQTLAEFISNLENNDEESEEGSKLTNSYSTQYTVPNLLDDKREFELKIAEAAKEKAAFTYTKDGKVYIKEGAAIGKTYASDSDFIKEIEIEEPETEEEEGNNNQDQTQNNPTVDENDQNTTTVEEDENTGPYKVGNYLRIIFRDTGDQVVENVEDYVEKSEKMNQQTEKFSMIGTVLSENEWVEKTKAYATSHGADSVFTNESELREMYKMCVENGINPEFIVAKAKQESSLKSSNGNYWGYGTPNGSSLADYGGWKPTLEKFIETLLDYQDPTSNHYNSIMERYEQRKGCTEWGGADPQGYGTPDTLEGISSVYSWLGDDHHATTSGGGGMYYLYPWKYAGAGYEGENKIIFDSKEEFEQKCGGLHSTSGGNPSTVPTTVWEQAGYTAWQVRKTITVAREIYGEVAGTYAGR